MVTGDYNTLSQYMRFDGFENAEDFEKFSEALANMVDNYEDVAEVDEDVFLLSSRILAALAWKTSLGFSGNLPRHPAFLLRRFPPGQI